MPYILLPWQIALLMLTGLTFGFGVAAWIKYPRHWLKFAYLNLLRRQPHPAAYVTRNGYLTFDILPRNSMIKRGKNGYINKGSGLNLFGFGIGNTFYERCNKPIDLSVATLEKMMKDDAKSTERTEGIPASLAYRGISAEEMGNIWYAWGMWAYDIFRAKAERATKIGMWIMIALGFMTLAVVGYMLVRQNQIVLVLQQLINAVSTAAQSGISS